MDESAYRTLTDTRIGFNSAPCGQSAGVGNDSYDEMLDQSESLDSDEVRNDDGDAVVERNGMQFFIDGESVPYLRGATLDFTDGLTVTGFRVVNPNASRTCGWCCSPQRAAWAAPRTSRSSGSRPFC